MITSMSNGKVKRLVALGGKTKARRDEGVFLVEGVKMFLEAPPEWIREVYVSEPFLVKYGHGADTAVKKALDASGYETLSDEVFRRASDTQTPQGILCVLRQPCYDLEENLAAWLSGGQAPLLALVEDLQDPGNLGTILRTGEGAGVDGFILTRQTVDIFNPKVIRSTMGSIYRVPFFTVDGLGATVELLKAKGVAVYASCPGGDTIDYDAPDYTRPTAFIIGNESGGIRRGTADAATCRIRIPMAGQAESLNAAAAAAILMYEAVRQRRGIR